MRPRLQAALSALVLFAAALLAVLPLALYGPSCGHDLTFHLVNWMDAARQWQHGTLRPWWCFPAAWHTGEPRYLFYPPLSWMLGALLTLVLHPAHAPLAYTFVALTLAGFTMRRFLAGYVSPAVALAGACLYLANPYALFTATERTAYAELLAAAWFPWLLRELLKPARHADTPWFTHFSRTARGQALFSSDGAGGPAVVGRTPAAALDAFKLAIPIALLWLTNTPAAILGTYTVAIVLAVRIVQQRRAGGSTLRPLVLPVALAYMIGLALSAWYLLPAVVQHGAVEVNQAFITGMRPQDGTLFAHIGEPLHDTVVRQASLLALLLLIPVVPAAASFFWSRRAIRRQHGMRTQTLAVAEATHRRVAVPTLLTLTAVIAFLLTPASLFLWRLLPELHFLQFPWRTLMLQAVLTVTLLAFAVRARPRARVVVPATLLAVLALGLIAHHSYAQFCDEDDAPASLATQMDLGFEPYDEYTPRDANNDLLHPGEPPAWTAPNADVMPATAPDTDSSSGTQLRGQGRIVTLQTSHPNDITVQETPAPGDHYLILREHRFRNWHVTLDGTPIQTEPLRDDDLYAIALPDGATHTVTLHYRWSGDEYLGLGISLIALFALLFLRLR